MRRLHLLPALVGLTLLSTCTHRLPGVASAEDAGRLPLEDSAAPVAMTERIVMGERGAYLLERGGAFVGAFANAPRGDVLGPAAASPWLGGAEMPALDGGGRWTLGLDSSGTIERLRGGGGLEPMNGRLGLPKHVLRTQLVGAALAALTAEGVYVSQHDRVTRIEVSGRELAGGPSALAVIGENAVTTVDLEGKHARVFAIHAPRFAAFTEQGDLVVATESGVYRENGSGQLALRFYADDAVTALATDASRIWFADGNRVGVLDEGQVKMSAPLGKRPIEQIALGDGELWILEDGAARHFPSTRSLPSPKVPATDGTPTQTPPSAANEVWPADVQRIVEHACMPCHAPGGEGAFELRTVTAFRVRKGLVSRVLARGTMPPPGKTLSADERVRLMEWSSTL